MTRDVRQFIRRGLRFFSCPASPATRRWAGWIALFTMLIAALPAVAQLDTGSISGTITDPSGSVVANAQVTASETTTGTSYKTTSSKAGYYVFPSVRTGVYKLTITSKGFKTTVSSGITVSIGVGAAQDFRLQVGAVSETVAITASALALETETSDVGTSIQSEQVQDLPLTVSGALRSLATLTFLVPGAVGPGTSAGGAGGGAAVGGGTSAVGGGGQIVAKINGGQTCRK
jgi:hypothetical protein